MADRFARAFVEERMARGDIASCGVAVVAGDEIETFVTGMADAARGRPVTPRTVFHICSCSKAFAASAFAALVDQGRASWDGRVRDVVPEFELCDPWVSAHCTFRDLAGMRLGLTRNGIAEWGFRPDAPVAARLARAKHMAFDVPFRDQFSYSNLGYVALAEATARIAGTDWASWMQQAMFDPLGLRDAALQPVHDDAALPHLPHAGGMAPVPELTGANSQGSARVHLSVADAAVWLASALRKAEAEMFRPQSLFRQASDPGDGLPAPWAYGLGWQLSEFQGAALSSHGGGGRGWRAVMMVVPEVRTGVMVMAAHEGVAVEAMALSLLELSRGRMPGDWEPILLARAERNAKAQNAAMDLRGRPAGAPASGAEIAGVYANPVTGRVRIEAGAGRTFRFAAEDAPAFDAVLVPSDDGVFDFSFDNPALAAMPRDPLFQARFVRGEGGGIAAETTYFGTLTRPS